jgi:hypothetical protein
MVLQNTKVPPDAAATITTVAAQSWNPDRAQAAGPLSCYLQAYYSSAREQNLIYNKFIKTLQQPKEISISTHVHILDKPLKQRSVFRGLAHFAMMLLE